MPESEPWPWKWDLKDTSYIPAQSRLSSFVDITGTRFNMLLAKFPVMSGRQVKWVFECDCGQAALFQSSSVIKGNIASCGCRKKARGNASLAWGGVGEISGSMLTSIKRGAVLRNLEYTATPEYMWNLFLKQGRMCALSGIHLDFDSRRTTASLDRIDSLKGYIEGNLQWVHKDVNMMKNNYQQTYFIEICTAVAAHAVGGNSEHPRNPIRPSGQIP